MATKRPTVSQLVFVYWLNICECDMNTNQARCKKKTGRSDQLDDTKTTTTTTTTKLPKRTKINKTKNFKTTPGVMSGVAFKFRFHLNWIGVDLPIDLWFNFQSSHIYSALPANTNDAGSTHYLKAVVFYAFCIRFS